MPLQLKQVRVGPWPMNTYAFVCSETGASLLIDPGAEPERVLALLDGTTPIAILLTHTHPDHIGALDTLRRHLKIPVWAHAGPYWNGAEIQPERVLADGEEIPLGRGRLEVVHTPGHTPDMLSVIDWAGNNAVVGDTLFEGGPGKTWSPADFRQTLETLRQVVLQWPDDLICHPGHGLSFRLGDIRARIERFLARDYGDFFGDATWEMETAP